MRGINPSQKKSRIKNPMADRHFHLHLPSEVITEILCRLPVKSLLRLRSTCKHWRSLIDSTHFIFLHLNKSPNTTLILRRHSHLYTLDSHALHQPVELIHPLMCYSNSIKLLGSSNGLLCISNIADDIAIWNPSIRKHRILPSDRLHRPQSSLLAARVFGFGFDSSSNDYKLLNISYFVDLHNRTFDSRLQLYTMRSDTWTPLPSMPYALCCARTMGVFVSGALHWVVTRKLEPDQPDLVVAFDLRAEKFREVPLPVSVKGSLEMDVAKLGECLCVVENNGNSRFDVWVMKEYGLQESWCKVFTVTQGHGMRAMECVKPLCYSGDGDRVLFEEDRGKLCWYDLKSEQASYVKTPGGIPNTSVGSMLCVGSLVPPTLLTQCGFDFEREGQRPKDRNTSKKRDDFLSRGFKLTLMGYSIVNVDVWW
ncbi:hypothetical protein RJT34_29662 [Clitoria ternatea]|uniref:F-box domain-containing protein n=1 Tax=Clitoria ternatea TaxID=43366 RepID=A0AAN9I1C4_CLITE